MYKNADSGTYSNYESQLIKMNTYWETQYNDSDRRYIQSKMRAIRTKWENKGYRMFHSPWEDWNGVKNSPVSQPLWQAATPRLVLYNKGYTR